LESKEKIQKNTSEGKDFQGKTFGHFMELKGKNRTGRKEGALLGRQEDLWPNLTTPGARPRGSLNNNKND